MIWSDYYCSFVFFPDNILVKNRGVGVLLASIGSRAPNEAKGKIEAVVLGCFSQYNIMTWV